MEAPPQYPGTPKKSNTGLIIGGIVLAVLLCCCGICGFSGYFGKGFIQKTVGLAGCSMAMQQQREGLLAYAAKHGDQLPPAANWQDAIKPYIVDTPRSEDQPFEVPTPSDDFCDQSAKTSLTYNSAVAGKKLGAIKDQMGTIALFETPGTGRNRSAVFKEPAFSSSPKILMDQRRGWIRQPIKGEAYTKDVNGTMTPMSRFNLKNQTNGATE